MNYPSYIHFPTARGLSNDRRRVWESQSPLLHPRMLEAFLWWAEQRYACWGLATVVTDIFRSRVEREKLQTKLRKKNPKARVSWIHGDWRGIDAGVQTIGRVIATRRAHPDEEELRLEVLDRWPARIARQPMIGPLNHGTAPHAHFQVTLAEQAEHMRSLV